VQEAEVNQFGDPAAFYAERYNVIARFPLVAGRPIWLADGASGSPRRCRFCNLSPPHAAFASRAHAVPEFLGNKSLFSRNECDSCNKFLADNYEDQLSKWSLFARALSKVRGKGGGPTYTSTVEGLRIESGRDGIRVNLENEDSRGALLGQTGPFEFRLPTEGKSQPHVPIRAAMALVKIACSICPLDELAQCYRAVDWLMGRITVEASDFPVVHSFVPGPVLRDAGEVILLKRNAEAPTPYLWLVVRFANHQLQILVPFCPADEGWFRGGQSNSLNCPSYPSHRPTNWPYGEATSYVFNWAGTELVQAAVDVVLHLEQKHT
jgi:hypothetical protein